VIMLRRITLFVLLLFVGAVHAANPTFVAASPSVQWGLANVTVNTVAGIANDDILLIFIASNAGEVPAISGFTAFEGEDAANFGIRHTGFWKRANGESGNYTTTGLTNGGFGFIAVIRGAAASGNPINASDLTDKTNSGQALTAGTITTTVNESLILFAVLAGADDTMSGWSGGGLTWTERLDAMEGTTLYVAAGLGTAPQATAGAITPAATMDNVSAFAGMFAVAIAPLGGGGGGGTPVPVFLRHYQQQKQ